MFMFLLMGKNCNNVFVNLGGGNDYNMLNQGFVSCLVTAVHRCDL